MYVSDALFNQRHTSHNKRENCMHFRFSPGKCGLEHGRTKKRSDFGTFFGNLASPHTMSPKTNLLVPNFAMADTCIDDGWSIIYDQIIHVESIYGIGLGVE